MSGPFLALSLAAWAGGVYLTPAYCRAVCAGSADGQHPAIALAGAQFAEIHRSSDRLLSFSVTVLPARLRKRPRHLAPGTSGVAHSAERSSSLPAAQRPTRRLFETRSLYL
jgi:hypothetical protein